MTLEERFTRHFASFQLPSGPILIAVSGGPDSLALLSLLLEVNGSPRHRLVIAHADHGIHSESARVAAGVKALAERLGLDCTVGGLALGPNATETVARRARYRWLRAAAREFGASAILTGHHREDQTETLLMRFLAGSGPAGLAGMAAQNGLVVRPVLPYSRSELHAHLHKRGWVPWEDPANADPRFTRSWLRSEVLPALRSRWGDLDARLQRGAAQAADHRLAWDHLLESIREIAVRREPAGVSVAATRLGEYDSSVFRCLLGALGRRVGCTLGTRRADQILGLIKRGRSGSQVELGAGWIAELSFDRLRLIRPETRAEVPARSIEGDQGELVVGRWRVRWGAGVAAVQEGRNAWGVWVTPGAYRLRSWQSGDRIRPLGAPGRRLVVRCMQDERISRSERTGWLVVEDIHGTVVWVPGVSRAAVAAPVEGVEGLRIDVELAGNRTENGRA